MTSTLAGGMVQVKPGLTPRRVVVTGTKFFGWLVKLASSGFTARVMTVTSCEFTIHGRF